MVATVAIVAPARTSSGGGTVSAKLVSALEDQLGEPVPVLALPPRGSVSLPRAVAEARNVIFLGTRVVPGATGRAIFWPLSVAPLDHHVLHLPHTGVKNRARQRLLRLRLAQTVERADALMFGSHYARSLYLAQFRRSATLPYAVIPNGAPSLPGLSFGTVRENPDPLRILVTSHLDAYKGILEFVAALALVPKLADGSASVRIAGADREPGYAREVRQALQSSGLDRAVTVEVATPTELAELYRSADLFVFSSVCENAGSFSLFDAFHAGLPVICSDRSSMPELVGTSALLVNPYDPVSFADAINSMIDSTDLRREYASRAQRWATAAATWDDRAAAVLSFVKRWDQR